MAAPTSSRAPIVLALVAVAGAIAWVVFGGTGSTQVPTPAPAPTPASDSEAATAQGAPPPSSDSTVPPASDVVVPDDLVFRAHPVPASVTDAWINAEPETLTPGQARLLEAWAGIQRAEAAAVAGRDADRGVAEGEWVSALRGLGVQDGLAASVTASHAGWAAFREGWDTLSALAAGAGTDVSALTRSGLDPELASRVGDSGVTLVDMGLADPDGTFVADEAVLRVLFRWRWVSAMAPVAPTHVLLPLDELRYVHRWRIVAGTAVAPARRLQWIDEYVAAWDDWDGLPAEFARAVVYADAGDADAAAAALDAAAHVEPRLGPLRDRYAPAPR